jgi:acetyl esterase
MDLDEEIREFLTVAADVGNAGHAGDADGPVRQRRSTILGISDRLFDAFGAPGPAVHAVDDHRVGHLALRVYRPDARAGRPVHMFLHGGGFWLGSIDEKVVDATCRERCAGADCVVVAVEYRLAPEHPFPAPVEDCYAALLWIAEHAAALGGDPARVSVGGVSAGATLAAATAIAARDRGGPRLALQLLEVPLLDLTLGPLRASGVGDRYGISAAELQMCCEQYLPEPARALDPLASPLLAPDLSGLPPARILTAEFDPLRDDGRRYAERLTAAGIDARHTRQPGAVHGSNLLTGSWAPARQWRDHVLAALRAVHLTTPDRPTARGGRPDISNEGGR